MDDSIVSNPRIDVGFVTFTMNGKTITGNLTQNAYKLLYELIRRTGGVNAGVIDLVDLQSQIDAAGSPYISQQAPSRNDYPDVSQAAGQFGVDFVDILQMNVCDVYAGEALWQT